MRLTKLDMHGFKSFAKKTQLEFADGITAVIGPNGSGKSNIADAVRWVLGEQSAKALRGARMEDVIFNGTQERKAQTYCEVALTFDNSDGALPIEFNEVTVSRCVYRSGESEYALNRNACRLKDIQELFRDTGIGKEGYSIIGQGKVEEILSNRSNDRRIVLEEAAGIMKYRVRKEEAVRKLDNTRKNLDRLLDILEEMDNQREPLKEQAETAKLYLQLREELKSLDINVFLHQYERTKEKIENSGKTLAELQKEGIHLQALENAINQNYLVQEEQLRNVEQAASALQNKLLIDMSAMESHTGEAGVLRERRENLKKELERLQQALRTGKEKREIIKSKAESLSNAIGQDMLKLLDDEIKNDEQKQENLQKEIEAQENLVEEQKNSVIEQLNKLSDAKSQLSRMEAMTTALGQRIKALEEEYLGIEKEHGLLLQEQGEAQKEWDELKTEYEKMQSQLYDARKKAEEAAAQSAEISKKIRDKENEIQSMKSRSNVLEEMASAHEGYYSSVKNIMRDASRDINLKRCVLGVVAEIIQVPEKYETALEMSLGASLQNIVTPTPEDGKKIIEHLRKNQYGRATLLPVSSMRPRLLNNDERSAINMQGVIGVAAELVSYDPKYRGVVENLLGRTVLVTDIETGIQLNKRAGSAFRIATIGGDIIHPGGSMTGGSVQKREFSLLGRERELKQLKDSLQLMEGQMRELVEMGKNAANQEALIKQQFLDEEKKLHTFDLDFVRQKEKLELIERDIGLSLQKLERNALEKSQIDENLADIEKERQDIIRLQNGIEEGNATTKDDVLVSQNRLNEMRQAYESANSLLTERKVQRMALKKEEDAYLLEKDRLNKEIIDTESEIIKNIDLCKENQKQSEELSKEIDMLLDGVKDEQASIDALKDQQTALEEERQKLSQILSETRQKREELIMNLRDIEEKKHRQDVLYNRADIEFNNMQERILEDYELTYEQALPLRAENFGVTAAHIRIDEIRSSIRELGNINVNAVEDYKALFERYEQLSIQCDDLNKAEADLQQLISELTATMENQFNEQFALIQKNFTVMFERLFGGGWADLRLSDPKDVLNCEIDIIAQPPGKKLQLLSLLSGGERALTAIALLFAILTLKPTVFCILDEIESSLDEVNVARFANYLRDYSDDTQFILITHRKGSMEVCNTLYGVAMEEKGVSKIVSARLQESGSAAS